jgi:hypothetical protein
MEDPSERFQRGSHKGENKLGVYAMKVIPGLKMMDTYLLKGMDSKVKFQFDGAYQ